MEESPRKHKGKRENAYLFVNIRGPRGFVDRLGAQRWYAGSSGGNFQFVNEVMRGPTQYTGCTEALERGLVFRIVGEEGTMGA